MKGVFGVGPIVPLPKFHIDHPDNRPRGNGKVAGA
jgi:hypothetical protein